MKLLVGFLGLTYGSNPFPRNTRQFCETTEIKGASCHDVYSKNPAAINGIYKIQVTGQRPTIVECIFEDGVGWTVIQKRTTGNLDFNQNWKQYVAGFTTFDERGCAKQCTGEESCEPNNETTGPRPNCNLDEYWIGLENIHQLTLTGSRLRIDLERFNKQNGRVQYGHFNVGDSRSGYTLKSVGLFQNDAQEDVGDSFMGAGFGQQGYSELDAKDTSHIGMKFSTKDNDQDKFDGGNCAREDSSGWWFNRCSAVNLNGKHYGVNSGSVNYHESDAGFDDGILWQTWTNNKYESLIGTRMMVGPFRKIEKQELTGVDCQNIARQLFDMKKLTADTPAGRFDDLYQILPKGLTIPKYTECEFEVCDGQPIGWTMIQKRYDGSVDFNQNWNAYRDGFGCLTETGAQMPFLTTSKCDKNPVKPSTIGECWLGNSYIHALTENALNANSLKIQMSRKFENDPNDAIVAYNEFVVGDEQSQFKLIKVSGFANWANTAGNAFAGSDFGQEGFGYDVEDTIHTGMMFSTKDRDNDLYEEGNCGSQDRSGWWFNRCSACNLNGHYYKSGMIEKGNTEFDDGLLWNTWTHTKWESITKSKMWVGPFGSARNCQKPSIASQNSKPVEKPPAKARPNVVEPVKTTKAPVTLSSLDIEYSDYSKSEDEEYWSDYGSSSGSSTGRLDSHG